MAFWENIPFLNSIIDKHKETIRQQEDKIRQLEINIASLQKEYLQMQLEYKNIEDKYAELDADYDNYVLKNEEKKQRLIDEKKVLREKLQKDCDEIRKQRDLLKTNYSAELEKTKQQIAKELENENLEIKAQIERNKKELIEWDEKVLLQSFALYKPQYQMSHSLAYAEKLDEIREKQKRMAKDDIACICNTNWTVNNSVVAGRKMIKDTKKLLLRTFNVECDDIVSKVKYNNHESCLKRMEKSYDAINKLGKIHDMTINNLYLELKKEEMYLALEYEQKKKEERDYQRELRAEQREIIRVKKELEAERDKIRKEKSHYENALEAAKQQIKDAAEAEKQELLKKIRELESHLEEVNNNLKDVDYREANQRAGYVYIISNIGSFGENVYKIGMTRRLDPMERIYELGGASVPFNFDVHAMIFTDDAPKLESALHRAFEDKKLNMVNTRREFFRCSLDEIKKVVKENYDGTAEFYENADAEQYRESIRIRESIENNNPHVNDDYYLQ